jgi:hypothetical protein
MLSASSRCPEKRKAPVFTEARRRPGYPQSLGELYLASRSQSIDVCVDLGRLFAGISRLFLVAVALFLGWLTPVHAIGPSSSVADDVVIIQMPAVAPPVAQVFLGAYRGQGPPEIIDSRSFNAAAVRIQHGTSQRFIFVVVCKSGRSARLEDGLYGAYFVPNGTDPSGEFYAAMLIGAAISAAADLADQVSHIAENGGSISDINWMRVIGSGIIGGIGGGAIGAIANKYILSTAARYTLAAGLGAEGAGLSYWQYKNNLAIYGLDSPVTENSQRNVFFSVLGGLTGVAGVRAQSTTNSILNSRLNFTRKPVNIDALCDRLGSVREPWYIRDTERIPLPSQVKNIAAGESISLDPSQRYLIVATRTKVLVGPEDMTSLPEQRLTHPVMAQGEEVRFGGELNFVNGRWVVDNNSGRYGFYPPTSSTNRNLAYDTADAVKAIAQILSANGLPATPLFYPKRK